MNLKDLSRILDLSPTTVSRALNGFPEVSEATRQRVIAAAEAHGYRPNMRARSLATGRAMAIGHVVPLSAQHEMVNPVFADFITGASEIYSAHGYDILLSLVPDAEQDAAYRAMRAKGSVDGVIVHSPRRNDSRIHLLNELCLPFVVHGRASDADEAYSWVDMNNFRAFEAAANVLLDLGHRRIALLNGLANMDFAIRRDAGFHAAHAARGLTPDPALMFHDEMTEAMGHDIARALLTHPAPPTAFLTSSIMLASGVRRALEESGLRMGRDVSVMTHDDELSYFRNGRNVPIFTAIRSSVREAGRQAARILIGQIESPIPRAHENLHLEAELVLGASTGPCKSPGKFL